jgi:hypothetical protein
MTDPLGDIIRHIIADTRINAAFRAGLARAIGQHEPVPPQLVPPTAKGRPMKVYSGRRNALGYPSFRVQQCGDCRALRPRPDLVPASAPPNWGDGRYAGPGSASAQLALAILADALGDDRAARRLHLEFERRVISKFSRDASWHMSEQAVLSVVRMILNGGTS